MTSSSHPFSDHRHHPQRVFAADNHVVRRLSPTVPHDGAVIITDENGNIQSCNAEAQHIFHCLPSYSHDKKLNDVCTIVPRNRARYAPTLWELAHSTRRPLAFPEIEIALPGEATHRMDVCTVWLHEPREGHLRIAFVFSSLVQKSLENKQCESKQCENKRDDKTACSASEQEHEIKEGIIVLRKHTIIETSSTLDAMLGYKEKEIIGRDISYLMSDTDATRLMYAVKTNDTSLFQGLVMCHNHLLIPVGFRSFQLTNAYSDVVVTRLYAPLP